MSWKLRRRIETTGALVCAFVLTLLFVAGCGGPDSTALESPPATATVPEASGVLDSSAPTQPLDKATDQPAKRLVRETWDLVLVDGAKVGHSHFEEFAATLDGQPVRELVSSNELSMQRFGQTVTQSIEATSIETVDGQVLRFGTKMLTGPSELTIAGQYRDGKMYVETATLGKKQTSSFDWKPEYLGFFADQQSLQAQPLQPGETRTIVSLVPGTAQAGEMELSAVAKESTQWLGESRELLRINSVLSIAGTKIKSVMWANEQGEVLKMVIPGMKHETYRTTKEIALSPVDKSDFDVGTQTVVKIAKPFRDAHKTTRVVYRARLASGSPVETFASCQSQLVKRIDERVAEITVTAVRPTGSGAAGAEVSQPTAADLQPNNLIQSDDGAIVSLAERFAEGQTDPWTLAKIFESGVGDYVHSKNFSQAISSAADVVRSQEGDCTEHAVLLAALCRAKGIPARVAIGLVYFDRGQGFAYHMWNEVWIDNGWVPIDATLGLGGIGAAHLKIADSDLASASPISALLPVVEVIGQLELEVLSVE